MRMTSNTKSLFSNINSTLIPTVNRIVQYPTHQQGIKPCKWIVLSSLQPIISYLDLLDVLIHLFSRHMKKLRQRNCTGIKL